MTLQLISSISATSLSSRATTPNLPPTSKNGYSNLYSHMYLQHNRIHTLLPMAGGLLLSKFLRPINRNITHRLTRLPNLTLHRPPLNPFPHIPHHNLPTPFIHKNNIPQPRKPSLILLIQFP